MPRLRTDFTALEYALRRSIQPTLHGLKRGVIYIDDADIHEFADGALLGTVLGLPVKRKAALDDGQYQYYDDAGNVLSTNAE